ncbi:MAG: zinc ribbon domain-containing protein [Phycisphaeraceae bacterium]|nr:zinc ribbon domain-containing protein [Phycisphaeraceae bacterium]
MPDDTNAVPEQNKQDSSRPTGAEPRPPLARPAGEEPAPIELVDDTCPKCGATLAHDAVLCIKCGYDLKANVVREPGVGVVEVDPNAEKPKAAPRGGEFVVPGRGGPQVLATAGVFLALGALIFSGVNTEAAGVWVTVGTIALMLYNIALHTCTGVAAVAVAAKLSEQAFGRFELAAARMFLAVALFHLVVSLRIPVHAGVAMAIKWGVAMGVYYLAVMLLFKKDRAGAALIALAHFVLWVLLQLGAELSAWVAAAGKAGA